MSVLSIDQLTQSLGWYGKMPAAGDFMHRRLDQGVINWWHQWLEQGLMTGRAMHSNSVVDAYMRSPIWNFVLPAKQGLTWMQMGSIAPSRDRVGRLYPLLISLVVPSAAFEKQLIEGSARFYQYTGQALLQAVGRGCSPQQFEASVQSAHLSMSGMLERSASQQEATTMSGGDILSILNEGHDAPPGERLENELLRWPELSLYFEPEASSSFWWTNSATGAAHRSVVHGGAPNTTLFETLFVRHQA
ncbi:MAG: type VI secretion system-associated protein TagF [Pelistega sp.]|nr:type VI secretion system-associated protein TagF [Pelistega sp.]